MCLIVFSLLSFLFVSSGCAMSVDSSSRCTDGKDGRDGRDGHDCGCLEVMKLYVNHQTNAANFKELRGELAALKSDVNNIKSCNKQGKILGETGECSDPVSPTSEVKWVTFNGKTMEIYGKKGVGSVTRHKYGYMITWSHPFSNSNYAISGSSNMLNTSGLMFDLEGNNIRGYTYNLVREGSCVVGTREPRSNSYGYSDYISVIAIGN
ncbi:uncharacterized protein LOC134195150 [Corticium candelabrum]|uniref:uncharacterized protein LOC134195150 n=1 Tax=Corticium candelabrum TaxID=121492 RepID=UPI002E26028D|nr:uncharacterized protein LOC134195150 [Corticium candelabrum]